MASEFATIKMDKANKLLQEIASDSVGKRKRIFGLMATMGFRNIIAHFKSQRGPSGKWKRRKESTRRALRRRHGTDQFKLLQVGGTLRQSITPAIRPRFAMIFSKIKYAGIHNKGGRAGKNHAAVIPQREYLWIDKKTMNAMAKAVLKSIF